MRNLVLLFTALILGTTSTMATVTTENKVVESTALRNNNSFIFVEDGITFSVYPDGEFDFYIDNRINNQNRDVTFNSGYDYSPYAQYDDYGAVIQVENIPVYYDHYGRVSQIGDVNINYRNGRVNRLGGMYVFYNNRGLYDYHTGYINTFNRRYVWRPFHAFFARPLLSLRLVHMNPYRRWYNPIRYTYYNPYRFNKRRTYAKIGKVHRYNQIRNQRASVYRNDKRVAVRQNRNIRSNKTAVVRRNNNAVKNNRTIANRGNNTRKAINTNRKITNRSSTVRSPRTSTVTKKTVTRTPQRTTVNRSTTVKRPQSRTVNSRNVSKAPSRSRTSVATRSATSKRTVSRAPARKTNTYSRSTSSRSIASSAPSRSTSRSTGSSSSSTRRRQ